jgi:hypothetical protein
MLVARPAAAGSVQGAPQLVAPALCAQFSTFQSITHTWNPVFGASSYLVSFASSIGDQFGNCAWDAERQVSGTSITVSHEQVHHPLHWRARAKFPNGDISNAAIGYYFVGTAAPSVDVPCIVGPWGTYQPTNTPITHSWQSVPGAVRYEIQFANAFPHTLDLFDACGWDAIRSVTGTSVQFDHQSCHFPLYWRIRAVGSSGERGAWAGSYYSVSQSAGCLPPVAVESESWGRFKHMYH